jgi:hypothetical protein
VGKNKEGLSGMISKKRDRSGTKRPDKEKGIKYLLPNPLILLEPMGGIEPSTY